MNPHFSFRWLLPTLLATLIAGLSASCSAPTGLQQTQRISFHNPPRVGAALQAQHDLVGCTSVAAARYVSATGFKPADCRLLGRFERGKYIVAAREKLPLTEGEIWLLTVEAADVTLWVPLPWHNWA